MNHRHSITRLSIGASLAACALLIAACSPSSAPDPNAKKVLMACLVVSNIDAGQILGGQLTAFRFSGDKSPVKVCAYNDAQDTTRGLLQIQKADKITDPAADLAADEQQVQKLFKNAITPLQTHPADGFGPGAFFVDNTQGPNATSVQLHLIQNGYKLMLQVNNPKDFASGEKQAAAMAQRAFANIQGGAAFQFVP